ncbi:PREDICTED: uncharacterized protein LOC108562393 [Nicrophorus vespilloides]|uniref:Uncharacterized protein LOC108562393 n=1 Tax=Nicrophorus vespilloides TaxID=110193 RepID=A0ABM1MNP6_NICVS|nr:PREDICTED: uncharacterized protein LOC108562393 [Nicrophorus vespilloides]
MDLKDIVQCPLKMKNSIGSNVEIETVDKRMHTGVLHCIDPMSSAIVLINENETENEISIINFNSVQKYKTISPGYFIEQCVPIDAVTLIDEDTLRLKREKLRDWFKLNLIDIEEDGKVLKYKDYLIVEPPYDTEHCYCTNTIILERIYDLINKMPS